MPLTALWKWKLNYVTFKLRSTKFKTDIPYTGLFKEQNSYISWQTHSADQSLIFAEYKILVFIKEPQVKEGK